MEGSGETLSKRAGRLRRAWLASVGDGQCGIVLRMDCEEKMSVSLIPLLIKYGPSVFRGIGSLIGGKTGEVAGKLADVADAVKGQPKESQHTTLEKSLAALPPEERAALSALEIKLAEIDAENRKAELTADTAIYTSAQETARIEQQYGDEYTKQTRPKMARLSGYCGFGYALGVKIGFPLLSALVALLGVEGVSFEAAVDTGLLATILAPLMLFSGVRMVDKNGWPGRRG